MAKNGRNRGNGERKIIPLKTPKVRLLEKILRLWDGFKKHHIFPKSRGGNCRKDNIKELPGKAHWIYHELFLESTPEEAAIILLLLLRGRKKKWTTNEIEQLGELIIERKPEEARKLAKFNKSIETIPFRLSETISKMKEKERKKTRQKKV